MYSCQGQTNPSPSMPSRNSSICLVVNTLKEEIPNSIHLRLAVKLSIRLVWLKLTPKAFNNHHRLRHHYVRFGHHISFHRCRHRARYLPLVDHQEYCCWCLPRLQRLTRPHLGPRLMHQSPHILGCWVVARLLSIVSNGIGQFLIRCRQTTETSGQLMGE
jgi:hypothetical protein